VTAGVVGFGVVGVCAKETAATDESRAAIRRFLVVVMTSSEEESRWCSESLERARHLLGL
jgi:hypothetical protein